jgi:YVTN family beta-propeller protein
MILAPVITLLSNDAFAQMQTLHNRTLYEVTKQTSESGENPEITVGDLPIAIAISPTLMALVQGRLGPNLVYVANAGEESNEDYNSVSVISGENNTKIEDLTVGNRPEAIAVDLDGTVYVANADSGYVSVIDTLPNMTRIVQNIAVDGIPQAIAVDFFGTVYVAVANASSGNVSVIATMPNNTRGVVENIRVDSLVSPTAIAVGPINAVYVANAGSGNVSVIDTLPNMTRIVQNIAVGGRPQAITAGPNDAVYVAVANDDDSPDTVSVIATMPNNTRGVVENIRVGDGAVDMAVGDTNVNAVYVANAGSDSVSVISTENNRKIEDIPVGDLPIDIAFDFVLDTIYVANAGSDSVSVIDGIANRVVAGITFQINPFNSGYIVCHDLTTGSPDDLTPPSPIGEYIYVYSGTECIAKPNDGFEFISWEENLGDNSTQLITISRPASPWDSIAEFLRIRSDEPEAKLNITKFGTFTANFKELPPAIPPEFWLQSYVLVGTVIAGLSIPTIIGWIRSKRDVRKLKYYHRQIASLYGDGKLDENDIEALDRLRSRVLDAYSEGKINEKHYESLRAEISTFYEEIFRKKIDSLNYNSITKKSTQEQITDIKNEVEYAYSKGKINEKHYDLLNKVIANLDSSKERDTS